MSGNSFKIKREISRRKIKEKPTDTRLCLAQGGAILADARAAWMVKVPKVKVQIS